MCEKVFRGADIKNSRNRNTEAGFSANLVRFWKGLGQSGRETVFCRCSQGFKNWEHPSFLASLPVTPT